MKSSTIIFLVILIVTAIYIPRAHYSPGTSDAYWHMAIGRYVWQTKQIPDHSPFVYAYENTKFTSTEWLSGLIYYLTTLTPIGDKSIYIVRTALALLILVLLKKTYDLVTKNSWLTNGMTAISAYLLGFRFSTDRPEIFSYLFLALINYVCFHFWKEGKISKLAYSLPLIFLAWPNMHALGAIGLVVLFGFLITTFLDKSKRKSKDFKTFAAICITSAIIALLQWHRFFYFLLITIIPQYDIKELGSLTSRLSEIKYSFLTQVPPEVYIFLVAILWYIGLLVFDITQNFKAKKYPSSLLNLFFLGILATTTKYYRLVTPSLLLSSPALVELTEDKIKNSKVKTTIGSTILVIATGLMLLSALHGFIIGARNSWQYVTDFKTNIIVGVRNHNWIDDYPYKTNRIFQNYLASKRIFTSNPWRSYYVWYFPNLKIPSDVIFEYQNYEDFNKEEDTRFAKGDWQKWLEKYNVDTVINSPIESSFSNFTPVYELPGWKLVYTDEIAAIYAKEEVIKSLPLDLSKVHPELNTYHKFKDEEATEAARQLQKLLDFEPKNLFGKLELIKFLVDIQKDYPAAQKLAQESYDIAPSYPYFSLFLAKIDALTGNCPEAEKWAKVAQTASFHDIIIGDQINSALAPCHGLRLF